eukprot:TRINITY_DN10581_c0_g1_i1.p2 TRINITY_DN10581_c0_g1~~TRINITY_DN10581_c0_g1_i1.p2  ORF type:complete len:240 (+),score=38.40 TRINITY_DN10581_c0_g1_i1:37-756(+)
MMVNEFHRAARILRGFQLMVAAFVVLDGALSFIYVNAVSIVIGLLYVWIGAFLILLEFKPPQPIIDYCPFLHKWLGRGLLYIFLGVYGIHYIWVPYLQLYYVDWTYWFTLPVVSYGIICVLFHFVAPFPPPQPRFGVLVISAGQRKYEAIPGENPSAAQPAQPGYQGYQSMPAYAAPAAPAASPAMIAPSYVGQPQPAAYYAQAPPPAPAAYGGIREEPVAPAEGRADPPSSQPARDLL